MLTAQTMAHKPKAQASLSSSAKAAWTKIISEQPVARFARALQR
jgi:hypothetical protein